MNGWQPIETVPNNVFDVLAKYYDAGLNKFMYRRFTDCVIVVSEIFCPLLPDGVSLTKAGFRPTHWRNIPEIPGSLKTLGHCGGLSLQRVGYPSKIRAAKRSRNWMRQAKPSPIFCGKINQNVRQRPRGNGDFLGW